MSIGSRIGRGLVALGVLAAASSTAMADRRTGMAGNLLIEDKDDVFIFPNLTSTYRNLVSLDYGATDAQGNALLTLGNADMAYGVALHRGDVLTPHLVARNTEIGYLNDPPSLFPAITDPAGMPQTPATIVDFLLATGPIGIRVALGRGVTSTTDGAGDTTNATNTYLMGEFGWGNGGVRGESARFDVSGALLLDLGSTTVVGDDALSGTAIGLSGLMRGYLPQDEQLDLGILANIGFNTTSVSAEGVDNTASTLGFNIGGGVGPAFRFGAAQVAAYATLRIGYSSNEPDSETDDDESGTLSVVIPGVNIATEIPLNDWFVVRTGAQYDWAVTDTSGPGDAGAGSQDGVFGWNAGLGVIIDQFRFDGSLQQGFVTSGPDFIGGAGGGFFAIAALTYSFDAARSGTVPAETAVDTDGDGIEDSNVEPVAPAEPAPALAPAPPPGEPAPAPAAAPVENPETGANGTVGGSAGGSISIGR